MLLDRQCYGGRHAGVKARTETMIELFEIASSGNCYRVRLMLGLLALPSVRRAVTLTGHHVTDEHVARLNPLLEVPVIVDGAVVLRDSQAILVYLAGRYGSGWMPGDPAAAAAVVQWLSFAANEIQHGPRMARAIARGIVPGDLVEAQRRAERALNVLDQRLRGRDWLEAERPTIADVACYPYVWNAAEGGLDLAWRTGVTAWLQRIEALPGFVPMDG